MISARKLTFTIHEYDFAQRAKSHGATGNRNVVLDAAHNLPDEEFFELRAHVQALIEKAVKRTEAALAEMGVEIDMRFPMHARSSYQGPIGKEDADKQP